MLTSESSYSMSRILLIEDDLALRTMMQAVLRQAQYTVQDASDGLSGWALAQETLPDLVIADIQMPGMDGYDLLAKLRQNPQTATIPVILVTALSDREAVRRGMTGGADDYLTKPFEINDLLAAVRTRLQRQAELNDHHDTTMRILRKNIVYSLPHEMRTPLHHIMGYAQLLEMENARSKSIVEATQAIKRAGERLERLIENYLLYAQLELIGNDPEEIDLLRNHITRDVQGIITSVAKTAAENYQRAADLKLQVEPYALRIAELSLAKIVGELVDNALKFSEPGTPIEVQTRIEPDKSLLLMVIDHGRGMTAEQINKIGAYVQFERSLYEQQGLGMGLFLARRLVELHGGRVDICSKPGQGTQIISRFPR
jgi:signal transduction histidine kinase